jgi:hypothetical protein
MQSEKYDQDHMLLTCPLILRTQQTRFRIARRVLTLSLSLRMYPQMRRAPRRTKGRTRTGKKELLSRICTRDCAGRRAATRARLGRRTRCYRTWANDRGRTWMPGHLQRQAAWREHLP